jgi:N-acetylglucosaminyl-diphospho-decaprenol L-rhamnosyltransferase
MTQPFAEASGRRQMPDRASSIDVVIPTYGRDDLLLTCLDRLAREGSPHTTFVIDSHPGGETASRLQGRPGSVQLIELEHNRGFGAAVNHGIRAGTGEFVVVLNNDVQVAPGFLEQLVAPLRSDPRVGMVAALLLRPGSGLVDSFGLEVDRCLSIFPRCWGADPREADPEEGLLGPTGAAAAYRRRALELVGGLDERIFAYGEDADLALRLRLAGWRCAAASAAHGIHVGSASFGRRTRSQLYHLGWSRGYLLRKYRVLAEVRPALRSLASDGSSVALQLLTGSAAGLRGRVRGWRAARPEMQFPSELGNGGIGIREAIARRWRYRA